MVWPPRGGRSCFVDVEYVATEFGREVVLQLLHEALFDLPHALSAHTKAGSKLLKGLRVFREQSLIENLSLFAFEAFAELVHFLAELSEEFVMGQQIVDLATATR